MLHIGVSDAGGVDGTTAGLGADGMIEDPVQGSWIVLASDKLPAHDEHLRVSVLSWRSTKLKRRVTSTLASEYVGLLSDSVPARNRVDAGAVSGPAVRRRDCRDLETGDSTLHLLASKWKRAGRPPEPVLNHRCEIAV